MSTFDDPVVLRYKLPIESIGKNYAGRYLAVTIGGKRIELKIPKGTRGLKVGGHVIVRNEQRDWYKLTRMEFNLRDGTESCSVLREEYHDGARHDHFTWTGE
jgi:hypothetical protein